MGFLQLQQARAALRWGVRASHCGDFSCCEAQALGTGASAVVAGRFSNCSTGLQSPRASTVAASGLQSTGSVTATHGLRCPLACEVFPDQGSNLYPMHMQAILNHWTTREDLFLGFSQSSLLLYVLCLHLKKQQQITIEQHKASFIAQLVKSVPTIKPGFNSWVGKIPWRRTWQPTPVLLPGESHGQRSLEGYSPWGRKSGTRLSDQAHSTHTEQHVAFFSLNHSRRKLKEAKRSCPWSWATRD